MKTFVIIPAYNEEESVGKVIKDIPGELVSEIIVVDNNSTDQTGIKLQLKQEQLFYLKV